MHEDFEIFHTVFRADFDTGVLYWKSRGESTFKRPADAHRWNQAFAEKPCGGAFRNGYVSITMTFGGVRRVLSAHRVIWMMKFVGKTKGASYCKRTGRWVAPLMYQGKNIWLGRHDTKELANDAYAREARKYYGDFARA